MLARTVRASVRSMELERGTDPRGWPADTNVNKRACGTTTDTLGQLLKQRTPVHHGPRKMRHLKLAKPIGCDGRINFAIADYPETLWFASVSLRRHRRLRSPALQHSTSDTGIVLTQGRA